MQKYRNIIIKALASVLMLVLAACSDDLSEGDGTKILMQVAPYGKTYVESDALTRAAIDGYENFTTMYAGSTKAIAVYLSDGTNCQLAGNFTPSSGDTWTSTVNARYGIQYYVYGFYPADCTSSASVTGTSTGATIELPGLGTFSPTDVCVISGVNSSGNFGFIASKDDDKDDKIDNLLLDHIYSCIRLEYRVDSVYAKLRTIKLKEVKLETPEVYYTQAEADEENASHLIKDANNVEPNGTGYITTYESGYTAKTTSDVKPTVYETQKATVTLSSSGPSVTWSGEGSKLGKVSCVVNNFDTPGKELNAADKSESKGFQQMTDVFVPVTSSNLTLKIISKYDVYDKAGTCIRTDCTATNTITLGGSTFRYFSTGTRNIINMTVTPTYLYKLSQPDTDYPTIVLSN